MEDKAEWLGRHHHLCPFREAERVGLRPLADITSAADET